MCVQCLSAFSVFQSSLSGCDKFCRLCAPLRFLSVVWALPCECRWPGRAARSCGSCKSRYRTPSWGLRCAIGRIGWTVACARTGQRLELSQTWAPRSSFLGRPSKPRRLFRADVRDVTRNGRRPLCDVLIFALSLSLSAHPFPFFRDRRGAIWMH